MILFIIDISFYSQLVHVDPFYHQYPEKNVYNKVLIVIWAIYHIRFLYIKFKKLSLRK